MKKLISAAASLAMLLSSAAPALAGTRAINRDTGAGSNNTATATRTDVVLVRNSNTAIMTMTGSGSVASSGGNVAQDNDGDAAITTHTANSGAVADALVNASDTTVEETSCTSCHRTVAVNDDTGADSTNVAVAVDSEETVVRNRNLAVGTVTEAGSEASSGDNTAQGNDGNVTITAGSATSSSTAIATVNTNVTRIYR